VSECDRKARFFRYSSESSFFSFFLTRVIHAVVPAIAPKILAAVLVGAFAVVIDEGYLGNETMQQVTESFTFTPFTALGVAISLFLGFHNNASYGRWWEARILWGTQLIAVRNIIRFLLGTCCRSKDECEEDEEGDDKYIQSVNNNDYSMNDIEGAATGEDDDDNNNEEITPSSSPPPCCIAPRLADDDWRVRIVMLSMAQTHALRGQLRRTCKSDAVSAHEDRDRFLTEAKCIALAKSHNPASAILLRASRILGQQSGLSEYSLMHASTLIDRLCEIQAGCERIHNTGLPFAYSLLVHRTSFLYVFLAPFALASSLKWWTPVFSGILAYTFFGLDELARHIQEPFRDEQQCLALSAMCRTIERDVCEALHRPIPPPLHAVNGVLM
jgi:ion channel-forming bestrophin family protein